MQEQPYWEPAQLTVPVVTSTANKQCFFKYLKRIFQNYLNNKNIFYYLYCYNVETILGTTKIWRVVHTKGSERHRIIKIKRENTNWTEERYCTLMCLLSEWITDKSLTRRRNVILCLSLPCKQSISAILNHVINYYLQLICAVFLPREL